MMPIQKHVCISVLLEKVTYLCHVREGLVFLFLLLFTASGYDNAVKQFHVFKREHILAECYLRIK